MAFFSPFLIGVGILFVSLLGYHNDSLNALIATGGGIIISVTWAISIATNSIVTAIKAKTP